MTDAHIRGHKATQGNNDKTQANHNDIVAVNKASSWLVGPLRHPVDLNLIVENEAGNEDEA